MANIPFTLTATTASGPYLADVTGGAIAAGNIYTLEKEMEELKLELDDDGTSASPYKVGDKDDLETLITFINNGGSVKGKYFKITAENGTDLESTCPVIPTFGGIFDGNGKTISNYVNSDSYVGKTCLFYTFAEGGEVKDFTIKGSNTGYDLDGIAYYNYGAVIGCVNRGTITISSLYDHLGGIVNYNERKIIACYNVESITVGTATSSCYAGGIAGFSYDTEECPIIGCYNMGEISSTVTHGGIYGYVSYKKNYPYRLLLGKFL